MISIIAYEKLLM